MTEKTTLLAYLVPKDRAEDMATKALTFILNKDEACRDALNDLLRAGGFDLEPIERVETQVAEKRSRPDMTGYDRIGDKRLLVEAKFWADLRQEQASGYFDQLDEEGPGVLLFIVLESRREILWEEIKGQMDKAGKELERVETFKGNWRAHIVGSDKRLLLVGWDFLLRRMAAGDSSTASDIWQLRGLVRQQDDAPFQPIHTEELASSLAHTILFIDQLIHDVINSRGKKLGITIKDRRRMSQPGFYGQYFRFMDVEFMDVEEKFFGEFFIGINFRLWKTVGDIPLWLRIDKTTVRVDVEKLQSEFPLMPPSIEPSIDKSYYVYVPIDLKTGEEYQAVLDDVVSQIGKIRDAIDGSGQSVDPPTHSG